MGLFDKLFGKKYTKIKVDENFKPITGGDGLAPQSAAILNCASQGMANHLIDKFIKERHGEKNFEWSPTIEYFVNEDDIPKYTIRAYGIELSNGETQTYYFNIGRPHNNEMNMAKLMGLIPKDVL
jgi:hypothetical protein